MTASASSYRSCSRASSLRRLRLGFTLIETVGVVALVGILLSLSATTLNRAYRVHHHALSSFRQLEQLNFWCERFRVDCQQATAYQVQADVLLSRGAGETVRYALSQGQLIRSVERDAQPPTREALNSPRLAQVNWTVDTRGRLPLVSCDLVFDNAETAMAPIEWVARLSNLTVDEAAGDRHDQ